MNIVNFLDICLSHFEMSVNQFIEKIYLNINSLLHLFKSETLRYFSERVILASLNAEIDDFNHVCLNQFSEDSKMYLSVDTAIAKFESTDDSYSQNYLNIINLFNMSSHTFTLKV